MVVPRLFTFRDRNRPLFSMCGLPFGNGPVKRAGSPPGVSTLMTSAPRSARALAHTAPGTPCAHSTTRMSERG